MDPLYARLAPWLLTLIELSLSVTVTGMIFARPSHSRHAPIIGTEHGLSRLARRRVSACVLVGLLAMITRAVLIPILGIPAPRFDDEFSYLLAADTFAHGRLANPTHPLWIHFESYHIIHQPTYMSMYPPAQGLVLAAGQLMGSPWIGQWLVTAAFCACLCWMLQGWVSPKYALLGGLIAVLRLGVLSYWMNGYWAASVAALGGTLILGALPRLKNKARVRDAAVLAIGLVILANSRPYEGLVFSLPIAASIAWWMFRDNKIAPLMRFTRVAFPIFLVLAAGVLATGNYYKRVTGSPFRMAYQVNREMYSQAPYFLWQKPRPEPPYHHASMRDFYRRELGDFETGRTVAGFLRQAREKALALWQFYLGPILTIPLLGLWWALRDRKMRFPVILMAVFLAGLSVETWTLAHYFAPATGLLYLFLVQSMRHLRLWRWRHRHVGASLVAAIPVMLIFMILIRVACVTLRVAIEPPWPRGNLERVRIAKELSRSPRGQLVIARYAPEHNLDEEYVYNAANIDAAKVVWARDMGEPANQELLKYYPDRDVWLLTVDSGKPTISRYPSQTSPK